jgi:hypothetical protein
MLPPVQFSAWHPLDDAGRTAPAAPGVLQARAEGLLPYPSGKSAMVFYDAAGDSTLASHVAGPGRPGLDHARACGAAYVRFAVTPAAAAAIELGRLLTTFRARFGALPRANQAP